MENIFVLIFSLFRENMFDGIAEHEGRETELANAIFYEIVFFFFFFFLLFLFNLFPFKK